MLFEVVVAAGVLATPWLLTRRTGESSSARIERIKRQGLEQRFTAEPADEALARELIDSLERSRAISRRTPSQPPPSSSGLSLVNRLDQIVAYHALSPAEIRLIAERVVVRAVGREGVARRGVKVTWNEARR